MAYAAPFINRHHVCILGSQHGFATDVLRVMVAGTRTYGAALRDVPPRYVVIHPRTFDVTVYFPRKDSGTIVLTPDRLN